MFPTWGQNRSTSADDKPRLESGSPEQLQAQGWAGQGQARPGQARLPHTKAITGSAADGAGPTGGRVGHQFPVTAS